MQLAICAEPIKADIGMETEVPETRTTALALWVLQIKCGHSTIDPIPAYMKCALMAAIPAYLTHAGKLSFGDQGFQDRFAPQSQVLMFS